MSPIDDPQDAFDRTEQPGSADQQRVLRFATLQSGARFADRYEIREPLGSGGSGEVYRARDTKTDQQVAVKVLFPGPGAEQQRERLAREIRVLKSLNHPGIVRVQHFGEADGLLFVALELLEGESLRQRLEREGRLPLDEALLILDQLLDAIAEAHRATVIHRDIKPANVFLRRDPSGVTHAPRVVLLDFGLAKRQVGSTLTSVGQFVGTPEYVAPEQAIGSTDVGPTADLFSIGVLAARMLTGDSSPTPSVLSLTSQVTPTRAVRKSMIRARVPSWLVSLIGWCLEPNPAHRPRRAELLLERLRERKGRPWTGRARASIRDGVRTGAGKLLAAGILGMAALIAAVLFYPARVTHERQSIVTETVAGVHLHQVELPHPIRDLVTWDRGVTSLEGLGLLMTPGFEYSAFDPEYRTGLFLYDAWSGSVRPYSPQRYFESSNSARTLLDPLFPGYDGNYNGIGLNRVEREQGAPFFVATYAQKGGDPALVYGFDSPRGLLFRIHHLGRVHPRPVVVHDARESQPLLVFSAKSAAFGQRSVVFGIQSPATLRYGHVALPPFDVGARQHKPKFFTFLPENVSTLAAPALIPDGPIGHLQDRTGRKLETTVRIADGVPSADARGELDEATWIERERELFELLLRAGGLSTTADRRDHATALESFARSTVSPTQAAVAQMRAAVLRRAAGDVAEAFAISRELLKREPELPAHLTLFADLATRHGEWELLWEKRSDFSGSREYEALVLASLLSNRVPEAVSLRSTRTGNRAEVFARTAIQLQLGDPLAALTILDTDAAPASYPEFAFLKGLTLLVADPPEHEAAHAKLEQARLSRGGGHVYPTELAIAVCEAALGGPLPSESTVMGFVDAQHQGCPREPAQSVLCRLGRGPRRPAGACARRSALRAPPQRASAASSGVQPFHTAPSGSLRRGRREPPTPPHAAPKGPLHLAYATDKRCSCYHCPHTTCRWDTRTGCTRPCGSSWHRNTGGCTNPTCTWSSPCRSGCRNQHPRRCRSG